jgi:hypothetical protein
MPMAALNTNASATDSGETSVLQPNFSETARAIP